MSQGSDAPLYDAIGGTYSGTRAEDPTIAAAIRAALGDAGSVVNVGAGTGAYEPADMTVIPIEPSRRMIDQRGAGRASALLGTADRLPVADRVADAALTVLSDHHWSDRQAGLRELRRVARRRVVVVNADPALADLFWLTREYLPEFHELIPARFARQGAWQRDLEATLGPLAVHPLLVPHDCRDGFYQSYWRRPGAYLSTAVRANVSVFRRLDAAVVGDAIGRLRTDLASGTWARRNAGLVDATEIDVGMRIAVAELGDDD